MNIFNTLPSDIVKKIIWFSSGPPNLNIYNKKIKINSEINFYKLVRKQYDQNNVWHFHNCAKYGMDGIYLNRINTYEKTPELEIEYKFSHKSNHGKKLKAYFQKLHMYA
tara:strand:- start:1246 stop:1572 length:327 start_codon:yes stop_codon:yes gene_type:complete